MERETFSFKKFKIIQNSASVFKVNTEAVLLTAWANTDNVDSVLEIGCGTGVISLGLVQKLTISTSITAIDINPDAIKLTKLNCETNHIDSINVIESSIQKFGIETSDRFDLIISNPPYFKTTIQSKKSRNILAKYTDTLSFEDLALNSAKLLNPTGKINLIIPTDNVNVFNHLMSEQNLFLTKQTDIFTNSKKKALRSLLEYKFNFEELDYKTFFIKDEHGYTNEFKSLTEDYYTIF